MRKCFTINPNRSVEEIKSYEENLVKTNIYQGCEIFYPYLKNVQERKAYKDAVKSLMKYDNFEIVCHLPYGSEFSLATEANITEKMKGLKEAIDFASNFDVRKLTLHPGELDGTLSYEDAIIHSVKYVKELCQYAKRYKMTIMIENLVGKNELCKTAEEIITFINKVDEPNIKVIVDCGHYNASYTDTPTEKNLESFIYALAPYIIHLHLSNNHGTSDGHGPLDKGTIDFYQYFLVLNEIGYKGLYCTEVLYKDYNDLIKTALLMDSFKPINVK